MTATYKGQFTPAKSGVHLDVKSEYAQAKMDEVEIYGSAEFYPVDVISFDAAASAAMVNHKIKSLFKVQL